MDESKNNKLPPIIVDYIEKVSNPHLSAFSKDIYVKNLERIRDACTKAIDSYYKKSVARR